MYKFFKQQSLSLQADAISQSQVEKYAVSLKEAMTAMGATAEELDLVSTQIIINAIRRNRKPEDVAWAILQ